MYTATSNVFILLIANIRYFNIFRYIKHIDTIYTNIFKHIIIVLISISLITSEVENFVGRVVMVFFLIYNSPSKNVFN